MDLTGLKPGCWHGCIPSKCAYPGSEAWRDASKLGFGGPTSDIGVGRENDQTTQWILSMGQKTIWV